MQQRAYGHEASGLQYPKGANLKCCQLFTLEFPVVVAATEPDPIGLIDRFGSVAKQQL